MNYCLFCLLFFLAFVGPLAAAENPPNLVDKLLAILGNKNLPRIDIPAPDAPIATSPKPKAPALRSDALEIATNFLPVYPLDHDLDDNPRVIPFYASGPLNQRQGGVTTLIIMLPDESREAAKAYAHAKSAQDEAVARNPQWNAADSFIFAPQFLNSEDIEAHAMRWPDAGDALLRWGMNGWAAGEESLSPASIRQEDVHAWQPQRGLSSFAVMDFLLLTLARPKLFPDLKRVVIAGSGLGGAFVQRYAALGVAPDILVEEGITLRFVPALAQAYMYFDALRAQPAVAGEYNNPDEPPVFVINKECARANAYPYGLEGWPAYARRQGENAVRLRYSARQVIYLTGEGARLPQQDATPDGCALTLQGDTLKARAQIYFAHVKKIFGLDIDRTQRLILAPKINEDALSLWRSPCGTSALFADGVCEGNKEQ